MLVRGPEVDTRSFSAFNSICKEYGSKAAGLRLIPPAWQPEHACVSTLLHSTWSHGKDISSCDEFHSLWKYLNDHSISRALVRSSGITERLSDRGKYESQGVSEVSEQTLVEAITKVFEYAKVVDPEDKIGIVVQEFLHPDMAGHLSNEHRVSPTKNQWSYEVETPVWNPSKGLNSRFAPSPDPMEELRCGPRLPHQSLRSLANFLAKALPERCHVEWIVHDGILWVVQVDVEWKEHERGFDPTHGFQLEAPPELQFVPLTELKLYEIGSSTRWRKLLNLNDFDFESTDEAPKIYQLSPMLLKKAEKNSSYRSKLIREMTGATGNRAVVRTDCEQEGVRQFNLPRTDTVSAIEAVNWCTTMISEFESKAIDLDNFVFLVHAFLPAESAAWAYASPDNPLVVIDALWGLPDGLQVLPVDTIEVNVLKGQVSGTKSTYKPRFLVQSDDGTWTYQKIRSHVARSRVLSKKDALEIAQRTHRIARSLADDAQIMWFSGVPGGYGIGRNVPWFRSRERAQEAPRRQEKYPPITVRNPSELESIPKSNVTIRLSPEASLIRNEEFLQKVIDVAKERDVPVEIEGSILGHTYYRLSEAGVSTIVANLPKYYRTRKKQVFGKIVRDRVPANIEAGGEVVVEARLNSEDLLVGLAGKLFEELEEFISADDESSSTSELADLLEVLKGMAAAIGVPWETVAEAAAIKSQRRGGFLDGRVLLETSLPSPKNPLETKAVVNLRDLGGISNFEDRVEIDITNLVSTIGRNSIVLSIPGSSNRYRLSLRSGSFVLTRLDRTNEPSDNSQLSLFDLHSN